MAVIYSPVNDRPHALLPRRINDSRRRLSGLSVIGVAWVRDNRLSGSKAAVTYAARR